MTDRSWLFLFKAITYRILATLTTAGVVFVATGRLELAGLVAGVDFTAKLVLYWLYEHLWEDSLKRVGLLPTGQPATMEQGHHD